ncbi:tetratricopeptide repeat protein [Streptomyces sp. NPDC059650]|uniref:tetratricopeptide repeat protein n=1 Tax=Streptomyces sp. NPDC059650 TaxID=3346896 RepID=UPI0036781362
MEGVVAHRTKVLGPAHRLTLMTRNYLAVALRAGRRDEAVTAFRVAIERGRAALGPDIRLAIIRGEVVVVWCVRLSAALAYVVAAVLSLWTAGLPSGVPLPVPGLVGLAWTLIGLVWLRVVALWTGRFQGTYFWVSIEEPCPEDPVGPVSLAKGADRVRRNRPGVLHRVRAYHYDGVRWVYLRQSAVWLLLPVSFVALAGLGDSHGSQHIRSLLRAGAAYGPASVAEVADLTVRRSEGEAVGYDSTLLLALPGGVRVRAEDASTRYEPRPDGRVQMLWAPSAPSLGGGIAPGAFVLLLILVAMVPVSIAAEDDGLQELAWSPVTRTVHACAVTGVLLAALPFLSGTASGNDVLGIGAACVGLPALYLVMPIRALLD